VYVADAGKNRVQKFSSAGEFRTAWGSSGYGEGQFAFPTGIEVDSIGFIYVADSDNYRIQKFH
jgi:DNA-binding beta-propeller fold protein YncE